jgi:hypothetical protein
MKNARVVPMPRRRAKRSFKRLPADPSGRFLRPPVGEERHFVLNRRRDNHVAE